MNLAELIQKKLGLKPEEAEAKAQEWAENEEIAKALEEMQDVSVNEDGSFTDENAEKVAQMQYEKIFALASKNEKGKEPNKEPEGDEGKDPEAKKGEGKDPEAKDEGQDDPKNDDNKDEGGKGDEGKDPEPTQTGNSDKIKELEKTIAELQAQNKALLIDSDLKLNLINSGASLEDVDYLIFKIKKDGEIATDKDGKIKDIDKIIEGSKKANPKLFNSSNNEEIDPKKLQRDDGEGDAITQEQFNKMSLMEKSELYRKDKKLYNKLMGKGE